MLKVNAEEEHRDYLDYLTPFIREQLAGGRVQPINETTLHAAIRSDYGLRIPRQTLALCLKRLTRNGVVARNSDGEYAVAQKFETAEIAELRRKTSNSLRTLLGELIGFAKKAHQVEWSEEKATDALTEYLSIFGIECLKAYGQRTTLPRIVPAKKDKSYATKFIINSFIQTTQETAPDSFEAIIVLVKGHMLSNALLCPDLAATANRFSNASVFVDTPFVLRLLHLGSEVSFEAAKETIDLIRQLHGRVAIFTHTATEVHGVIRACASHMDDPRARGPLVREMRQRGVTAVDLLLLSSRLDHHYAELGIVRQETPRYVPEFQIDENVLEQALDEDIKYFNPRALEHDINSIRSIYALRTGKHPTSVEDCIAILVTTNAALARASYYFGQQFESSREISPVITDFSLANVAWLKVPFAATELPKLEVMSLCYAALKPSDKLWKKYLITIDKLQKVGHITARDHSLLRHSLAVQKELMSMTLGAEEKLTDETIPQLLERVRAEYKDEAEQKWIAERAEHENTKARRDEAEAVQRKLLARQERLYKRVSYVSGRLGRIARQFIFLLSFACIVVASFAVGELGKSAFQIPRTLSIPLLIFILTVVGHLLTVTHGVLGFSVRELADRFGDRVQMLAFRMIDSFLFPREPQPLVRLRLSEDVEESLLPTRRERPDRDESL